MNKKSLYIFNFLATLSMCCYASEPSNAELFEGKNILILGGTGYLGRAIAEEVLKYNPKSITIFSRCEVKHFNLSKTLDTSKLKSTLGDIRDYDAVNSAARGMDVVFHAAALKRMDLLESNVQEAIKTDIVASINVFNACVNNDVKKVIFISTDKACLPINAYGGCKFVSEKIFTNYDPTNIQTKFVVARFGNILQSTGSVIPIFTDKIKNGEDITLTDKDMTRFIVDKSEAVELIFNALRYGAGGEIFVKRLAALRVVDLIDVLKENFNATNVVRTIGLRPGEKMHETLINSSEMSRAIEYNNLFIVKPSIPGVFTYTEQTMPLYMKLGKRVNQALMQEYSSDQAVISKQELTDLFKRLNLL
ncbi:MAG: polysaccharide biosynthesis protein [Candidatus Dependentiae bacterium]|nr:polysaccharide biosynthesis protein [Candidatus Dependentiae bacterium]